MAIQPADELLHHAISAIIIATRENKPRPSDDNLDWWVTLSRRMLQRGTVPPIGPRPRSHDVTVVDHRVLWSLFPNCEQFEVDDSLGIDPRYERAFLDLVQRRSSRKAAFLLPQARFRSLGEGGNEASERWVDFLYAPPGEQPVVFEIDGRQHDNSKDADAHRDRALRNRGLETIRYRPLGEGDQPTPFVDRMRATQVPSLENQDVIARLRAAIDSSRLCFGIIEAVAVGKLRRVGCWRVAASVPDRAHASSILSAMAGLDMLWSTQVMPKKIEFVGVDSFTWLNPFGGCADSGTSEVGICVRWAPTWARLPADRSVDVVVQGVPVPAHAGWEPDLSTGRRRLPAETLHRPQVEEALSSIAAYAYGVIQFRNGQFRAIQRVLTGGDSCVLLPTGHGKTLIYQVALLVQPGLCLVVAPITALIDDQERRFLEVGVDRVAAIHSGRSDDQAVRAQLHQSVANGAALVSLVAPERFQSAAFREALMQGTDKRVVALVVVDEAHCVSEWGHDFRTSYLRLGRHLRDLCGNPPLLALTGTASSGVLRDVLRELHIPLSDPDALQRPDSFDRPNLHFRILRGKEADTFSLLEQAILDRIPEALEIPTEELALCSGAETISGVVFVPWSRGDFGVEKVRERLLHAWRRRKLPVPTIGVFAGRNPKQRGADTWQREKTETASRFLNDEISMLVATKAFGMGIDKPNIRWTVHVGVPSSIEAFAQEAGRAGRDPTKSAHCVIVSGQEPRATVSALLDPQTQPGDRRRAFRAMRTNGDIGRQLFFLYNSFPGVDTPEATSRALAKKGDAGPSGGELQQALEAWHRLRRSELLPTGEIQIPRVPPEVKVADDSLRDKYRSALDKALFRLSIIGVVDDLTFDYRNDIALVKMKTFREGTADTKALDDAALAYAGRIEPGRHRAHADLVRSAPADLDQHVEHLLRFVIELVYSIIEPARLLALRAVWNLTLGDPDDERIRQTIAAYLGTSPMASTLGELMASQSEYLNAEETVRRLRETPPGDAYEWAGAADRQLESYPSHPLLLLVRAAGEAQLPAGSLNEFAALVRRTLQACEQYDVDSVGRQRFIAWLHNCLLNQAQGAMAAWIPALWAIGVEMEGPVDWFDRRSSRVLRAERPDPFELDAARAFRLSRMAESTELLFDPFEEPS